MKLLYIIALLIPFSITAMHLENLAKQATDLSGMHPALHKRQLYVIGQNYVNFLDQFGHVSHNPTDVMPQMQALFSPTIQKWVNGNLVAETIEGLYDQIEKAKNNPQEGVGSWHIYTVGSPIADIETNIVVLDLEIPTEKKGSILVMKKLYCLNNGLIHRISEVFNFRK